MRVHFRFCLGPSAEARGRLGFAKKTSGNKTESCRCNVRPNMSLIGAAKSKGSALRHRFPNLRAWRFEVSNARMFGASNCRRFRGLETSFHVRSINCAVSALVSIALCNVYMS